MGEASHGCRGPAPWPVPKPFWLLSVGLLKPGGERCRSFARNRGLTAIARHEALPKVPSKFLLSFFNLFRMPWRTCQRRRSPDKESQA